MYETGTGLLLKTDVETVAVRTLRTKRKGYSIFILCFYFHSYVREMRVNFISVREKYNLDSRA